MKTPAVLIINAGSSSIKFAIYSNTAKLDLIYQGEIANIFDAPNFTIFNAKHIQIEKETIKTPGFAPTMQAFFSWLEKNLNDLSLQAVGHRVVHGGNIFLEPTLVTDAFMKQMNTLIPLAPKHLPANLDAIKIVAEHFPNVKQVACFDTAFHQTQYYLAKLFAIPLSYAKEGIIRYGFHGISYEYIASVLPEHLGEKANGKVIVAHLGSGASMCAMSDRKSVDTTMGFSPLDGLMMAKRCGLIDPGVLLYLLQEKHFTLEKLSKLLYEESGMLGVSGITDDVKELTASHDPKAIEAIDLFCYRAACELSSLCTTIEGCEAIIFTAGIGEKSAIIREKICQRLAWLGVALDQTENLKNSTFISSEKSKIKIYVIPTNEEYIIAKHTYKLCQ